MAVVEIKLHALKCLQCLLRIVPPFKKCVNDHFVCISCNFHKNLNMEEQETQMDIESCLGTDEPREELDKKFNNLKTFCQFGCGRRQKLTELRQHEASCVQRNYAAKCLIDSCSWRGFTSDLISHVDAAHPNNIIVNCRQPERVLDISRDTSAILVLLYDRSYYCNVLYWVQIRTEDDRRFAKVVHQGNIGVICQLHIDHYTILNQIGENLIDKRILKIFSVDHIDKGFDLTDIKGDTIRIYLKPADLEFFPKNVAVKLECPACKGLLCSPIHVCSAGHSICGDCKEKSSFECPTCSKDIREIRNYAIEKLTENFAKDCTNDECLESVKAVSYSKHLKVCNFRNISCGKGCEWNGSLAKFYEHYSVDHPSFKGNGESSMIKELPDVEFGWGQRVMIAFGKVFALKYRFCENTFEFIVEEITTEFKSDVKFEVRLRNVSSGYTIGFSGTCLANKSIKDTEEFYSQCKSIEHADELNVICDENKQFECVLNVFTE